MEQKSGTCPNAMQIARHCATEPLFLAIEAMLQAPAFAAGRSPFPSLIETMAQEMKNAP
jgi:hypothetical protein